MSAPMLETIAAARRMSGSSTKARRVSRILHENAELANYKALIFDCYGTLIDWERGIYNALDSLFSQKTCPDPERVFEVLGKAETLIQGSNKTMLYPQVLEEAYHRVTGELRLAYDFEAAVEFGASVGSWPAFDDSAEALKKLKEMGLVLVVLSNVDNESFNQQLEDGFKFDEVCTAEDIGSYKPDLRNFAHVIHMLEDKYDIPPNRVLSVANSKYHDIVPAHKIGIKAVWINRGENIMGVAGYEDIFPDWTFGSMKEFADVMGEVKGEVFVREN